MVAQAQVVSGLFCREMFGKGMRKLLHVDRFSI